MKWNSNALRRISRTLHRDVSYFFAGMVLIYAVSGIVMNHRDTINPNYTVERTELQLSDALAGLPDRSRAQAETATAAADSRAVYVKHYCPDERTLKVFLKGGSTLTVDLQSGRTVYEKLSRRPLLSALTRLHYNPGKWWTWFSDLFAAGLILITLTGLTLVRGPKGLRGRGGLELIAGIVVPLIFLLCFLH